MMNNRRLYYQGQHGYYNSHVPCNPTVRFSQMVQQQYAFVPAQHQYHQPNFLSFDNGWQSFQGNSGYPQDHRETIRQDILSQLHHKQPSSSVGHQNRK